ncbi:hypothetical protein [Paraflavitalea devenefica]|nr:hypothetical protein [Paraflavitalea devenefica]
MKFLISVRFLLNIPMGAHIGMLLLVIAVLKRRTSLLRRNPYGRR